MFYNNTSDYIDGLYANVYVIIQKNDDDVIVLVSNKVYITQEIFKYLFKENIRKIATETFKLLDNSGVIRVDFIYDKKTKRLYVNEVNTIPNCFSHHLWEEHNISYRELLDILINDAINEVKWDSRKVREEYFDAEKCFEFIKKEMQRTHGKS